MGYYDDVFDPSVTAPPPKAAPVAPPVSGRFEDVFAPPPPAPPTPEGKVVYQSSVLPLSRTDQGKVIVDWNAGIPGKIKQAFTLPGRVMSGEVPMPAPGSTDPNAYTSLIPEATNFASTFSPLNPAVRAGSQAIPGAATNVTRPAQPTPAVNKLFQVGGEQMDQFRDLPIRYSPAHIGDLAGTIEGRLIDKGIFRDDAPGIYTSLDLMQKSAGPQPSGATAVITPASLHALRQNLANKFGRADEHQLAPAIAREELDKFIASPPEGAVLARPAPGQMPNQVVPIGQRGAGFGVDRGAGQQAGALFSQALGNLAGGYRGEAFANLQRELDLRSAAAGGRKLDADTRKQIAGVLLDPKKERAYIPSEISGLEQAVYGDPRTNAYRDISKVLGGGSGLSSLISGTIGAGAGAAGATAFGFPPWMGASAAAPVMPAIGRTLGGRAAARTQAAVDAVRDATLRRTPYYQSLPPLPPQVPGLMGRDAIAHALTLAYPGSPPSEEEQ